MGTKNGKQTKPEQTPAKSAIGELFDLKRVEEIQEKIGKVTGLGFVMVDYTGEPVTEKSCFTGYCSAIRNGEKSWEICRRSDAFGVLQAAISRKPYVYVCPCGLVEVAIPIVENGAFLGGFLGGQILCDDIPDDVIQLSGILFQQNVLEETDELQKQKMEIRHYSYSHFMDIVNLVQMMMQQQMELKKSQVYDQDQIEKIQSDFSREKMELQLKNGILEQKIADMEIQQNIFFLSNTISSLSSMAVCEEAEQTSQLLLVLSDYLRNSVHAALSWWSLKAELEQTERYIQIACARYGERFSYEINVPEELLLLRVPVHMILPYVQNAIYYGIAFQKNQAKLVIDIEQKEESVHIYISENGPGYQDARLKEIFAPMNGKHEGVSIERLIEQSEKRFEQEYGTEFVAELHVDSGIGRRFHLRIPAE